MGRLIRTFVAVQLPGALRRKAVRLQSKLAETGAAVRWVREENIHLTLKFLGEIEELTIPPVCDAVGNAASGAAPFAMEVQGLAAFPNAVRPRTLWVGVAGGREPLQALQASVEAALEELGIRPEARRFTPHITIGRMRNSRDSGKLAAGIEDLTRWAGGDVAVKEIVIMTSELTPQGPHYSVVGRAKLKG